MNNRYSSFYHITLEDGKFMLSTSHFINKIWKRRQYVNLSYLRIDNILSHLIRLNAKDIGISVGDGYMISHYAIRK